MECRFKFNSVAPRVYEISKILEYFPYRSQKFYMLPAKNGVQFHWHFLCMDAHWQVTPEASLAPNEKTMFHSTSFVPIRVGRSCYVRQFGSGLVLPSADVCFHRSLVFVSCCRFPLRTSTCGLHFTSTCTSGEWRTWRFIPCAFAWSFYEINSYI